MSGTTGRSANPTLFACKNLSGLIRELSESSARQIKKKGLSPRTPSIKLLDFSMPLPSFLQQASFRPGTCWLFILEGSRDRPGAPHNTTLYKLVVFC